MIEALFLAFALAMDAFAVALVQGARFRPAFASMASIALAFGAAQGGMALIGWGLGEAAFTYVSAFDHWIAFALLTAIGLHMIWTGGEDEGLRRLSGMALLGASIATSIDALAAGITLPTLDFAPPVTAALIAIATLLLSLLGVQIGKLVGDRWGRPAEIIGGLILIALGIRIVLDHTGIISG
ncbi:manganese efflux pump MntP family protein [Erythrobacter sp. THAF29]|uniref:manganese efflux pump MntP n=1 Tax=Erythrobacter sp. THAF29 TaxID=2587851 RepID=UPI0012687810|nr:manganese efflux pump MntP family protein [Erythrobacter sp. THAF29]QFT78931.1 putative manganese efflux pump MntP [Erythrobacter sp. THAF29]